MAKVTAEYNLAVCYPEIAAQWDYEKNGELRPENCTPFKNEHVWWKCEHGHEWKVAINNRTTQNSGCPYCNGKRVTTETSLATVRPDLAKEWHPTKNGDLRPEHILPSAPRRIWWQCEKGHEWNVTANNRVSNGTNCPYCWGRYASPENCLANTYPEIAAEWNTERNEISAYEITPHSEKRMWWRCNFGHEWQDSVSHRTSEHRGCSVCNSGTQTSLPEQVVFYYIQQVFSDAINRYRLEVGGAFYEIDIYIPSLKFGIEYDGHVHSDVHKDMDKSNIIASENIKLIRIRQFNLPVMFVDNQNVHVVSRANRGFADLEESLRMCFNIIYNKSGVHAPIPDIDIKRDIFLIYNLIYTRKVANSFGELYPELLEEWDWDANLTLDPFSITQFSNVEANWVCDKNHKWTTKVISRTKNKTGCPYCYGRCAISGENSLLDIDPVLCEEWNHKRNCDLSPQSFKPQSNRNVWWACKECGHEWEEGIQKRYKSKYRKCPHCRKKNVS